MINEFNIKIIERHFDSIDRKINLKIVNHAQFEYFFKNECPRYILTDKTVEEAITLIKQNGRKYK